MFRHNARDGKTVSTRAARSKKEGDICWECLGFDVSNLVDISADTTCGSYSSESLTAIVSWSQINPGCETCTSIKSLFIDSYEHRNKELPPAMQIVCRSRYTPDNGYYLIYSITPKLKTSQTAYVFRTATAPVNKLATGSADLEMASSWLSACQKEHDKFCSHVRSGLDFPLKVIDCNRRMTFVIAKKAIVPYVCLSYVWGGVPSTSDIDSEGNMVYPKTIEDAIHVTIQLGFQYLWVDRYCIDSDNHAERHFIVSKMDHIYQGAELTIFAVAGSSPEYGLPGVNETPRIGVSQRILTANDSENMLISFLDPIVEISRGMWATRGWTLQEWILSRRRLVLTDTQMYFQCRTDHSIQGAYSAAKNYMSNESTTWNYLPFFETILARPDSVRDLDFRHLWLDIEHYFARRLTFSSDVVDAITGIINAYRATGDHVELRASHIYGLPLLHANIGRPRFPVLTLIMSLHWGVGWRHHCKRSSEGSQFPSWSWARCMADLQIHGLEYFPQPSLRFYHNDESHVSIPTNDDLKIWVQPRGGDVADVDTNVTLLKAGEEFSPWIDIQTWTITGRTVPLGESGIWHIERFGTGASYCFKPDYDQDSPPAGEVLIMFLSASSNQSTIQLLVIEANDSGEYKRVGAFYPRRENELEFEASRTTYEVLMSHCPWPDWKLKTVRLI